MILLRSDPSYSDVRIFFIVSSLLFAVAPFLIVAGELGVDDDEGEG